MSLRKPAQPAATTRQSPRLPLPAVRRKIWEAARDLVASGDGREISSVLASRFSTSERIIDAVLVIEGLRHERIAATLRTGIVSALEQAREADGEAEAA